MGSAWSQADRTCHVLLIAEQDIVLAGIRAVLIDQPGLQKRCRITCFNHSNEAPLPPQQCIDLVLFHTHPRSDITADLQRLQQLAPLAPVAVVAETHSLQLIREALAAQAAGFIPASTPAELIVAAVELMLKGGRYLPAEVLGLMAEHVRPAAADSSTLPASDLALTPRQQAVLNLLLEGRSNKEIARALGLTLGTVKNYVSLLLKAARAKTRSQFLLAAHPEIQSRSLLQERADDSLMN